MSCMIDEGAIRKELPLKWEYITRGAFVGDEDVYGGFSVEYSILFVLLFSLLGNDAVELSLHDRDAGLWFLLAGDKTKCMVLSFMSK